MSFNTAITRACREPRFEALWEHISFSTQCGEHPREKKVPTCKCLVEDKHPPFTMVSNGNIPPALRSSQSPTSGKRDSEGGVVREYPCKGNNITNLSREQHSLHLLCFHGSCGHHHFLPTHTSRTCSVVHDPDFYCDTNACRPT